MAKSVYQTKNNGNGNIYKLVIDHTNKTIERGYFITMAIGEKLTRNAINCLAWELLHAGYKEID